MSGKVLKPLLIGAAIIAVGVATGGIGFAAAGSANGFLAGALGAGLSVGVGTITTTAIGGALLAAGVGTALSGVSAALQKTPKATLGQIDRLNATINPLAPRVMVLGRQTAMGTDIRYVEPSGTDQEYIDYIIAVAAHRVSSIDKFYIDAKLAWTALGGVQGEFAGYLSFNPILEGTAENAVIINGGARWGASRRLTGCAYVHIRIKRTGNTKKASSPFSGGLSSRLTIIGDGMPMYDPRFDGTAGGSGPMRVDDQGTWAIEHAGVTIGDNLPLQQLARLVGWRINGKLSVGDGLPASRIDMADFIVGANLADEPISLVEGGSQRRYVGALVANENDQPSQIRSLLMASCNGQLRIRAGKIGLWLAHNDLAEAAADDGLNDDDVLSGFTYGPAKLEETPNIARGQYTDPSEASLFQMKDYPEIRLTSRDGIDRVLPLNLSPVENAAQAQRTVKQALQRKQLQWRFTSTFGERAGKYRVGSLVPFTFSATSFARKIFRVEQLEPRFNGQYQMTLLVESSLLYAWDHDERAAVVAAPAEQFDPLNSPLILGIDQAGQTADWSQVADDDGNRPEDGATVGMTDDEAAGLAILDAATAAALSAIAAAEAVITDLQGQATDAAASLAANAAAIIALGGDVNVLDTLVSTQGSQLATNTTSITNLNGTLGSYSTLLSAGRPNQVVNGDFSNGLANWNLYGVATYGIGFSATIGTYISIDASGSDGGVYQDIRVDVGVDYYISFEGSQNSGFCYVQGAFLDEARTSTVDVTPVIYFNGYDVRAVGHMVAPAGAAWLRVYGAAAPGNFNLTRMMVQRGGATIWQDQATVRTQQQVVSGLAGTTATLSATVSTQGASIGANSTAITTLTGDYATMASLVATQGASVAANTAAISTNAADLATVNTKLLAGRPNLLSNGDFSNGLAEWVQTGGLAVAVYDGSIGRYMDTNNPSGTGQYWIRDIPYPGPDYYTASFESVIGAYPAGAYVGFQVLNAAKTAEIVPGVAISPATWDARLSLTVPPAGAGATWLRLYIAVPASCGIYSARFMIQRGQYASIWRDEASVAITQQALSSLGTTYASLAATVAVQGATASIQAYAISTLNGNVNTLFARIALTVDVGGRVTGIEINGTPVAGGIKLHADYVSIEKPGGGARLEWYDGCIKVYNAAGNLKVKLGNLAA